MKNLETQFNRETLHEKDSKSTFRMLNAQFQKFIYLEVLKTSNYVQYAREAREDFKQYPNMEPQSFKDLIIQNMESIEKYNESRTSKKESSSSGKVSRLSRNETNNIKNDTNADATDITPSYDTKPMAEVPYTAEYNVFDVETQHTDQPENMNDTSLMEKVDSNTTPDSSDMCNNAIEADQYADDHEDEHVVLANLIANLKLDTNENKNIQKQLKKVNATLTHELMSANLLLRSHITFEIDAEVHFMTKILSLRSTKSIKTLNLKKKRYNIKRNSWFISLAET
ncbi:hypothetical protein Tco_1556461 [Tanacetum coccineum]